MRQLHKNILTMEELPSGTIDYYWIYADNITLARPRNYPQERIGKWMFFVEQEKVDEVWQLIKNKTEEGFLGINAKVATNKPSPKKRGYKHLICIYTQDYQDIEDLEKIAKNIRSLGLKYDLLYKTNQSTRSNQHDILYKKVFNKSEYSNIYPIKT